MALAALRVAGPMTAMCLGSWVRWRNWGRRWKASTALALVKRSQSYVPRQVSAASSAAKEAGGAISMVGMRITVAPRASSWVASSEAWWRVRVMRIRLCRRDIAADSNHKTEQWRGQERLA